MTKVLLTLSLALAAVSANATIMKMCGQAVYAMFDKNDTSVCVYAMNTCEAADLKEKGYYFSATGQCPQEKMGIEICGQGGLLMQHPHDKKQTLQTLDTCETADLEEMGWVPAQQQQ